MVRISGYISEDLKRDIQEIADRENRMFTRMISLLLQLAVKEKNRKRAKKSTSKHNTINMVQSNTE
jgi:hypothetical protein